MDNFLSNSHYQQYGGRDINYRHFICKDCSQKKKEYEPGQETDELPKNILNIGYIKIIKLPSKNVGLIMFQHDKFVGAEYQLEKGNYNSINLKENGVIPEKCSGSMQVLTGFTVKLYHRDNFKGNPVVLDTKIVEVVIPAAAVVFVDFIKLPHSLNLI